MTGTTRAAKSDMVRARVADEATKVAVPVIVRTRSPLRVFHRVSGHAKHANEARLGKFSEFTTRAALTVRDPAPFLPPSQMATSEPEKDTPLPLRQILLPVDGTPNSEIVVDWALHNFCRKGDQIHLLHVIPKCVVEYEFPLNSIHPGVRVRSPRTPRLSLRASSHEEAPRAKSRSTFPMRNHARRRYPPSSALYGFEEYVVDVPDPEQVRRRVRSPTQSA
jgi:hypothetical protein